MFGVAVHTIRGRPYQPHGEGHMMSVGYGLGMLAMGFVAIAIFGVIFYMITNREENNDD